MTTIFRHLPLILLAMPGLAAADPLQDLDALDRLASGAAAGSGLVARAIDRRLRLPACPVAPAAQRGPANVVTIACAARGWRLRVPLDGAGAGAVSVGTAPFVIRRGDAVTLRVESAGFTVESAAIADEDARRGERVRIRTGAKTPPATAEAVEPGLVRIRAFN